jgi:hypothetical protein
MINQIRVACLANLTQINKSFVGFTRSMNAKYLTIAALAIMMIGATALATEDAFADRKRHDDRKDGGYGKSQSLAQASECGNGFISVADFCQDIGSQNQGKENSVAQSGNQEINIGVELGGEPNGDLISSLLGETANSLIPQQPE